MNEKFDEIKTLDQGEVVLKLPGTDIIFPYSGGKTFVNKAGSIGYNVLKSYDIIAKQEGEAKGMFSMMGAEYAVFLNRPDIRELIQEMLASNDLHIFFSRTQGGLEVLTLPGVGDSYINRDIEGFILGIYSIEGNSLPSLEQTYSFHKLAIGDGSLVKDRETLKKETSQLVSKVNGVYEKILKAMENMGI